MRLIFATNNINKVREIRAALPEQIKIISLQEAGIYADIEEPYNTMEENADAKSQFIYNLTKENCFGEDSGLEVKILNDAPGVKSARYAEGEPQYLDNISKLLNNMKEAKNRIAHFKTVISLIINGRKTAFTGICPGSIALEPRGNEGFGYDPIFIPDGDTRSFGEMTQAEKQEYSHRNRAVQKLVLYLKN